MTAALLALAFFAAEPTKAERYATLMERDRQTELANVQKQLAAEQKNKPAGSPEATKARGKRLKDLRDRQAELKTSAAVVVPRIDLGKITVGDMGRLDAGTFRPRSVPSNSRPGGAPFAAKGSQAAARAIAEHQARSKEPPGPIFRVKSVTADGILIEFGGELQLLLQDTNARQVKAGAMVQFPEIFEVVATSKATGAELLVLKPLDEQVIADAKTLAKKSRKPVSAKSKKPT